MKGTGYNRVLPKAGRNCFDWAFVQGSTFVLQLNFGAKNPAFGNTQTVVCKLLKHSREAENGIE